jgi:hypothetical protein
LPFLTLKTQDESLNGSIYPQFQTVGRKYKPKDKNDALMYYVYTQSETQQKLKNEYIIYKSSPASSFSPRSS